MNDLIGRQAAIDALAKELYHNADDYRTAVRVIGSLPSAQTEHTTCYLDSPCEYQNKNIALPSAQTAPKAVIYSGDGYADGCLVYDSAECPECGYTYEESDKEWGEPYCPHCGQLLDWEMRGEQDG